MDDRELLHQVEEYAQALSRAADEHRRDDQPTEAVGSVSSASRASRWPRLVLVGAIVVAVLAASATAVLVAGNRTSKSQRAPRPSKPIPTPPVGATAAQLIAGSWSRLPKAPIPVDRGGTVVWSGHELIVWGGAEGTEGTLLAADGAAYNPSTRKWRVLPPAPISARVGQTSVWTGHDLIIWGGADDTRMGHFHVVADGASYSPATNTWKTLPPAPLSARVGAVAAWTGSRVVLLGGGPDLSNNTEADGATYDPVRERWQHTELPTTPGADANVRRLAVAIGGSRVLMWSVWTKGLAAAISPSSVVTSGADQFVYDTATNSWTTVEKAPGAFEDPRAVLWTGTDALVRGQVAPQCILCTAPGPDSQLTARYDPQANQWTPASLDPLTTGLLESAWTGAALFSYDPDSERGPIQPGDASVYDPATDTWARLARAPHRCSAPPVAAGDRIFLLCAYGPVPGGSPALEYTAARG